MVCPVYMMYAKSRREIELNTFVIIYEYAQMFRVYNAYCSEGFKFDLEALTAGPLDDCLALVNGADARVTLLTIVSSRWSPFYRIVTRRGPWDQIFRFRTFFMAFCFTIWLCISLSLDAKVDLLHLLVSLPVQVPIHPGPNARL